MTPPDPHTGTTAALAKALGQAALELEEAAKIIAESYPHTGGLYHVAAEKARAALRLAQGDGGEG